MITVILCAFNDFNRFQELLRNNIIDTSRLNLYHMEVLLDEKAQETGSESITYLYKLQKGKAVSSFGIK